MPPAPQDIFADLQISGLATLALTRLYLHQPPVHTGRRRLNDRFEADSAAVEDHRMADKEDTGTTGRLTRRDFIGATLIGAGAALLDAPCPAAVHRIGADWTGYGGVGDYSNANGNTADVVRSA